MNIDPKEKEKFNKIAEEWWDSSGKFAPLHKINPPLGPLKVLCVVVVTTSQ